MKNKENDNFRAQLFEFGEKAPSSTQENVAPTTEKNL
jgi:hypothetical protein